MLRFPVECRRLTPEGVATAAFAAETVDLSAGGIRIVASRALGLRDRLKLELRFGRPDYVLDAEATVVRLETAVDGRSLCGLRFDGLDRVSEQRVVQAVFAEERRAAEQQARADLDLDAGASAICRRCEIRCTRAPSICPRTMCGLSPAPGSRSETGCRSNWQALRTLSGCRPTRSYGRWMRRRGAPCRNASVRATRPRDPRLDRALRARPGGPRSRPGPRPRSLTAPLRCLP